MTERVGNGSFVENLQHSGNHHGDVIDDLAESVRFQYENPPRIGDRRFWVSWFAFVEIVPKNAPFRFWQTGTTVDFGLRPSMVSDPRVTELKLPGVFTEWLVVEGPLDKRGHKTLIEIDEAITHELYAPEATIVALVDGADEGDVWKQVRRFFSDARERFCNRSEDTLLTLSKRYPV